VTVPTDKSSYDFLNRQFDETILFIGFRDYSGRKTGVLPNSNDVAGVLLVYDVARLKTFENIDLTWFPDVLKYPKDAVIMLVGTKENRMVDVAVSEAEGREYAAMRGLLFAEVSFDSPETIDAMCTTFMNQIVQKYGERLRREKEEKLERRNRL
jgi:GTPase SAR1 family protein